MYNCVSKITIVEARLESVKRLEIGEFNRWQQEHIQITNKTISPGKRSVGRRMIGFLY